MRATLSDVKKEAKGTKTFCFKTKKKINYYPGQFIYLTLLKFIKPDKRGVARQFTISQSDGDNKICITTRVREESSFKMTLDSLKTGDEVEVDGPSGTFIQDRKSPKRQIFLAGGIGITPFWNFIHFDLENKIGNKIHLIYSNSNPQEIAFKNELEKISKKEKNITVDFVVSKPKKGIKLGGLTGRIDKKMLKKLLSQNDFKESEFWLSGPPGFVNAMEDLLEDLGVTGGRMSTDKFTGY